MSLLFDLGSIWAGFAAVANVYANRPAVAAGETEWTYGRLFEEADAFRRLLDSEIGRSAVLFAPRNTPSSLAFLLGAIGSTALPLLADPAWKTAELAAVAQRCGARVAAIEADSDGPIGSESQVKRITLFKLGNAVEPVPVTDGTAFGRFTSGTTGFSRCLQFCDRAALAASAGWCEATQISAEDRILCLATLNNGLAFNTSIFSILLSGGVLAFHPGLLVRGSLSKTLAAVQPTILVAFPFAYELLASGKGDLRMPSTMRLAVSSAAPLSPEVRSKWAAETGLRICDYYGLAELGPCTFNDGSVPDSMGVALPGVSFAITSSGGEMVEPGASGQIRVRTQSMASGYLDLAEPDFASNLDEQNYYVTKDMGILTETGHLKLRGRLGELVNIAGRKIDPAEVAAVIRNIAGVGEVVVRREDDSARPFLAAYIESRTIRRADVVSFCTEHLAQYKIPQSITILPELPRSAAGKVSMGMLATTTEGSSK